MRPQPRAKRASRSRRRAARWTIFGAHNLLDIRITGDIRYQYRPGTPELRESAEACVAAFRTRPLDLVQLVTGPSATSVRDFADAFRLRRKQDG